MRKCTQKELDEIMCKQETSLRERDCGIDGALNSLDLSGLRIFNRDLQDMNMRGVNFQGAKLEDVWLGDLHLVDVNFSKAVMSEIRIPNAALIDVDFSGADLRNINFEDCYMENVNFKGANILKCNFWNVQLVNTDLHTTSVDGAVLDYDSNNINSCEIEDYDVAYDSYDDELWGR